MITVVADQPRKLVKVHMEGFLTAEDVADFSRREQAAVQAMGLASGEFLLPINTDGNVIQTQEVMQAFEMLIHHPPLKAKRLAVVRSGVLTRMQSRRMTKLREDAAVFEHLEDAKAWLFETQAAAA
ncbi:hypothetical protein [Sphingomonas sp.]|uniref:hypothetical protein n=1 Tax=Sphingomonas sp. TaxID=28214 RepID=UPI0035BC3D5C